MPRQAKLRNIPIGSQDYKKNKAKKRKFKQTKLQFEDDDNQSSDSEMQILSPRKKRKLDDYESDDPKSKNTTIADANQRRFRWPTDTDSDSEEQIIRRRKKQKLDDDESDDPKTKNTTIAGENQRRLRWDDNHSDVDFGPVELSTPEQSNDCDSEPHSSDYNVVSGIVHVKKRSKNKKEKDEDEDEDKDEYDGDDYDDDDDDEDDDIKHQVFFTKGNKDAELNVEIDEDEPKQADDIILPEISKSQKQKCSKQKLRKNWCLTIVNLIGQFRRMNMKFRFFENNIDWFAKMCFDYWKKKKSDKIAKLTLVYEDPLHAHAHIGTNAYLSIRKEKYFNIPATFIQTWLTKKLIQTKKAEKTEHALPLFRVKIDSEAEGYLIVKLCEAWRNDIDAWISYLFKETDYDVAKKFRQKRAASINYAQSEIQKDVSKYVAKKKGKSKSTKKPGLYKEITDRLAVIDNMPDLQEAKNDIEKRTGILLWNAKGWTCHYEATVNRITASARTEEIRKRAKLPYPKTDWKEDDFNYGPAVTKKHKLAQRMNAIGEWIKDYLFDKVKEKDNNTLILLLPNTHTGKSTFIRTLCKRFKGFELKIGDKGNYGESYTADVDFFYIDSCREEYFTHEKGITFNVLEALAGAAPCPLPRRYYAPILTNRQPLIITTQKKVMKLGYFKGDTGNQEILQARSHVIQFSKYRTREETLDLMNYHLQKIWKIGDVYGKRSRKKNRKRKYVYHNLIDTDDEDLRPWDDRDHPGEFYTKEEIEQGLIHGVLKPWQKIKNRDQFRWPVELASDPEEDDEDDNSRNKNKNRNKNRNDSNRNRNDNNRNENDVNRCKNRNINGNDNDRNENKNRNKNRNYSVRNRNDDNRNENDDNRNKNQNKNRNDNDRSKNKNQNKNRNDSNRNRNDSNRNRNDTNTNENDDNRNKNRNKNRNDDDRNENKNRNKNRNDSNRNANDIDINKNDDNKNKNNEKNKNKRKRKKKAELSDPDGDWLPSR